MPIHKSKIYRGQKVDADISYSESVRKEVDFGRLEIKRFNISKEAVNDYKGSEIPDYENLGLYRNKIYRLFNGQPYDGIIKNIRGNSVALTIAGRAGQDVAVGDSKKGNVMDDIKKLLRDRFAGASDSDIEDVHKEVMQLIEQNNSQHNAIENDLDELKKKAHIGDSDETETVGDDEDEKKKSGDYEGENDEESKKGKKVTGDSNIERLIAKAKTEAVEAAKQQLSETLQAMRLVEPKYGHVVGDSAEDIYKAVLKNENISTAGVHPSAYRALVETVMSLKSKHSATAVGDSAINSRATSADFKDYL